MLKQIENTISEFYNDFIDYYETINTYFKDHYSKLNSKEKVFYYLEFIDDLGFNLEIKSNEINGEFKFDYTFVDYQKRTHYSSKSYNSRIDAYYNSIIEINSYYNTIHRKYNCIIVIDFDDTIINVDFPKIKGLKPFAKEYINKLYEGGSYIIINTCRDGNHEKEAEKFLKDNGIKYNLINENHEGLINKFNSDCRKISGDIYIDDKNLDIIYNRVVEGDNNYINWPKIYSMINEIINHPNFKSLLNLIS